MRKTQLQRVINLARTQKKFTTWDLINLGITQQNARIHYAREQFGCTCGEKNGLGEKYCTAREHIRCVKDNHYEYISSLEVIKPVFTHNPHLEQQVEKQPISQSVRERWLAMGEYLKGNGNRPENRESLIDAVQESFL